MIEQLKTIREALKRLLDRDMWNTCQHDNTHRGGVLWEICDDCGMKWADDRGGKPEWKDPPEWAAAEAALTALTQLEAMVGEPVAWMTRDEGGSPAMLFFDLAEAGSHCNEKDDPSPLYTAAPVAQQYEAGDMASAAAQGFRDGVASVAQPQEPVAYYYQKHNCFGQLVWNVGFVAPRDATHCYPLYTAAPVAQQPWPDSDKCTHGVWVWDDCEKCSQQPQAEPTDSMGIPLSCGKPLCSPGDHHPLCKLHKKPQAEAVPPGWVPVPVEPTGEMLRSVRDWSAAKYGKPIGDDAAKGCWGAMIAAAIAQQKGQRP